MSWTSDGGLSPRYGPRAAAVVVLLATLVTAGCLTGPGSAADGTGENDPTPNASPLPSGPVYEFAWTTNASLGDAGYEIELTLTGSTSCVIQHAMAGQAPMVPPPAFAGWWPKDAPREGRLLTFEDIPAARAHHGDTVDTGLGSPHRNWSVTGEFNGSVAAGTHVLLLTGRGIRAPPEEVESVSPVALGVDVRCEAPVEVTGLRRVTNLTAFSYKTMQTGTGTYVDNVVGARVRGHVDAEVAASKGRMLFQGGFGDGYGHVRARTPDADHRYVMQPYVEGTADYPVGEPVTPDAMVSLAAGSGAYRLDLDYTGNSPFHDFYGAVLSLEPITDADLP